VLARRRRAAALWTTLRALPLTREGLGRHIAAARGAALELAALLDADERTGSCSSPSWTSSACVGHRPVRRRARVRHARRRRLARREAATRRRHDGPALLPAQAEHAGVARDLATALAEHLTPADEFPAAAPS
jgi:hypothetical protein